MDLSKMTRDELEREATLRGVRDVTYLTRAELIRAIEAPPAAGAIDTAKAIFRGVLGVARTLRGRPSKPPPPAVRPAASDTRRAETAAGGAPSGGAGFPAAASGGSAPQTSRAAEGAARAASDGAGGAAPGARRASGDTQRLRVSETPSGLPAVVRPTATEPPPETLPARAAEGERRPTRDRSEPTRKMKLPTGDSGLSALPTAGRRDSAVTVDLGPLRDEVLRVENEEQALQLAAARRETATTVPIKVPRVVTDEPIPTRTMARLLHEQGHHRRALAILEKLVAQRPGDPELQADYVSVQHALGVSRAASSSSVKHDASARAELVTMLLPDRRVLLAWGLSEESLASAKSLGASGALVARVLVHAPGGAGAVGRTLTDKEVGVSGEWALGPIDAGSFVTAAVGFRDGERFVSVAAAPVLDIV